MNSACDARLKTMLGMLGMLGMLASCRPPAPGCKRGENLEKCIFHQGRREAPHTGAATHTPNLQQENPEFAVEGWSRVDNNLIGVAKLMAAGMNHGTVESAVRDWCDDETHSLAMRRAGTNKSSPHSWICTLPDTDDLSQLPIYLEHQRGAISISIPSLGAKQSAATLRAMMQRWNRVCTRPLRLLERDERLEDLYTCELNGGPQIVLGRFPRDIDAGLWQVSLMLTP